MLTVMSWSGTRSLVSVIPSILTLIGAPLGYPVVALCHGDPAALDLQDWLFHGTQPFTDDIDLGIGQHRTLDLSLVVNILIFP